MIQFHVPDMTCGACANRIGRALQQAALPAGVQVEIDVRQRHVRLSGSDHALAAGRVREAIAAAGYTAHEAAAAPAKAPVAASGGCCCASKRQTLIDVHQSPAGSVQRCCA